MEIIDHYPIITMIRRMNMSKRNCKQMYKESQTQRRERVRNEGAAFKMRVVADKTKYDRKKVKEEMRRENT